MIKKLTYDNDKCIIDCDGVVIPSHGVRVLFNSNTARPFMYFDPNANYNNPDNGVVLVGPNGSTHRNLFNQNMMLIKGRYQIGDEDKELLRGRIWEDIKDFGALITFWEKEYNKPISSEVIGKLKRAIKSTEGIDIGHMWLVFMTGRYDYYFIEANDYIFGDYSDPTDLDYAYTRQQNVRKGGAVADRYAEYGGYLPYKLLRYQSDENKMSTDKNILNESKKSKMVLSESDIRKMVIECIKRLLK